MARKRRTFNAAFKAKVALEAIKGHRTISELAAKYQLHATQINLWKKQLLEGAEGVFYASGSKKQADTEGTVRQDAHKCFGALPCPVGPPPTL